ncbi:MAG: HEAT repeat domain-containing protein [Planctomycetes bacterium]|nr:HEAT repeat domain-containing protein [Planctomycetota bacterium]
MAVMGRGCAWAIGSFVLGVLALGGLGCSHDRAIAKAAVKLQNPDAAVRRAAVVALGEMRDPKATRVLVEMLNDPDTVVRANAAAALGKVGDGSAVPALQKALADKKHWVRWDAARALGLIGDKAGVPDLTRVATQDANANVRRAAVEALAAIGDKSAIAALVKAVGDNDGSVAYAASRALEALTGKSLGANPLQWREWWGKEGKNLAATADAKGDSEPTAEEK